VKEFLLCKIMDLPDWDDGNNNLSKAAGPVTIQNKCLRTKWKQSLSFGLKHCNIL